MKSKIILKIKEEVEKKLSAGFLTAIAYSYWVANIVPMPKKDGKVHMYDDYRDLNWASLKDNFFLPHINTLIDNTATRGGNSCSRVGFVSCRLMSIRIYGSTLTQHVY